MTTPRALAATPDGVLVTATDRGAAEVTIEEVAAIEAEECPRWVWWSAPAVGPVLAAVRIGRCWDLAAVHRLLHGGWRAEPAHVWAAAHGLDPAAVPRSREPDLFDPGPSPEELDEPVGPTGHLRPEWVLGAWAASSTRRHRWAVMALEVARAQAARVDALAAEHPTVRSTVHAESAAEILCVELGATGLPLDVGVAEELLAATIGPRPRTPAEAEERRRERDAEVLRRAPGPDVDLRNPAQVRSLLRRVGVEVEDTRAWRLERIPDAHPVVGALLAWRKAERIATTYGYGWLDTHVRSGRLRGAWTASDGAAGRMTATAGLHNLPADVRPAVVAEPGHVFVRADLGQIEPRVLAAVSGDRALAAATQTDDLYAPVAGQLGVDRATAKVAVLGAMYGQTTGHGAQALRRLEAAYPVAMSYLHRADEAGQVGRDVRTYGGRLIRFGSINANEVSERDARARAAAMGRYGRNGMVQGAAAELFKRWAVTVRAHLGDRGRIVLCLHDELLVQAPDPGADEVAQLLDAALQQAVRSWAPDDSVRFLADVSVVRCWADAT